MKNSSTRAFVTDTGNFEHAGLRRRLLTHARYHTHALDRFMINPDSFCEQYDVQWLKHDRSTSIGLTSFDGRRVVIKRYNTRGPFHSVKRALRTSRAEHSWTNAHRLQSIGIGTAPPIAAVEERLGPVRRRAWYLSEFVDGELLNEWLERHETLHDDSARIAKQVERAFRLMRKHRVAHGDTKATNWIVARDQVHLIDLDAMRQYRDEAPMRSHHARRFERDVQRFLRNFAEGSPHHDRFSALLLPLTAADDGRAADQARIRNTSTRSPRSFSNR